MTELKYSKEQLDKAYDNAVKIFKNAQTEETQWEARKQMASIERCATELYGFEYADELARKKDILQIDLEEAERMNVGSTPV